jgi:hypothetical protein
VLPSVANDAVVDATVVRIARFGSARLGDSEDRITGDADRTCTPSAPVTMLPSLRMATNSARPSPSQSAAATNADDGFRT